MVPDQVTGVVRAVGHENGNGVTLEALETRADCQAETAAVGREDAPHVPELRSERLDDRRRAISAVIVDHQHLVVDAL